MRTKHELEVELRELRPLARCFKSIHNTYVVAVGTNIYYGTENEDEIECLKDAINLFKDLDDRRNDVFYV